jgi:hypothetical protein
VHNLFDECAKLWDAVEVPQKWVKTYMNIQRVMVLFDAYANPPNRLIQISDTYGSQTDLRSRNKRQLACLVGEARLSRLD